MNELFTYHSPIGNLQFEISNQQINSIRFVDQEENKEEGSIDSDFKHNIISQFDTYFKGKLYQFDLPINPSGTDFQKKVWKQLEQIEYGNRLSYGELAQALGDKNLVRAVGGANGKNPLPIIIPCHRVIGSNNKLVGYSGGLWRKKWLLKHEMANSPIGNTLF